MDDVATNITSDELDAVADTSPRQVGFSGRKTAEIVGITYRQLDYWARTDLVRPSLADAKGSGSRGGCTRTATCSSSRSSRPCSTPGIKLESVREVFTYLREQPG